MKVHPATTGVVYTLTLIAVPSWIPNAEAVPPKPTPAARTAPDPSAPAKAPPPVAGPSQNHLKMGAPVPDFKARTLDGAMVRLDELAYPGTEKRYAPKRPVLLDFFRTDCVPCIAALPQLVKLHERHAAAGLQVVMIALLEDEQGDSKLQTFLSRNALPFTVVRDPTDHIAQKYMGNIVSLPATFLVDRGGNLRQSKFSAKGDLGEVFKTSIASVLQEHAEAKAQ